MYIQAFTLIYHTVIGCTLHFWASQLVLVVKSLPASAGDAGDTGSIPGSGWSREEHGNVLQYTCLENSMDRGTWRSTVHGGTKRLKWPSTHAHCISRCALLKLINWPFVEKNHKPQFFWFTTKRPVLRSPEITGGWKNRCGFLFCRFRNDWLIAGRNTSSYVFF